MTINFFGWFKSGFRFRDRNSPTGIILAVTGDALQDVT